jgi:hypothetical protein
MSMLPKIGPLGTFFRISKVRSPLSLWNKVLRSLENNILLYFRQKSILMNATLTAEKKNSLLATQFAVESKMPDPLCTIYEEKVTFGLNNTNDSYESSYTILFLSNQFLS